MRVYETIEEMKSDLDNPTPLLNLSKVITTHKYTKFYAKIEWMNPFGSVKDRYQITNFIIKIIAKLVMILVKLL